MPKIHLRQTGFTYSARGPFSKNQKGCKNVKKHKIDDIFIKTNQIELTLNMTWLIGDFKNLTGRASDKILFDKAFNIPKCDGYQRGLASIV